MCEKEDYTGVVLWERDIRVLSGSNLFHIQSMVPTHQGMHHHCIDVQIKTSERST